MPNYNTWGVSYGMITFFENALNGQTMVKEVNRTDDIVFYITLVNGNVLKVLLVNEYVLGQAAVLRGIREFSKIEYIVTGANWNKCTQEAKDYGRENNIGVFNITEFLGALNRDDPKKYVKKER